MFIYIFSDTDSNYFFPSLFFDIEGYDDRLYFDFPVQYQQGCDFLAEGQSCPLQFNGYYDYSLSVPYESTLISGLNFIGQFVIYDSDEYSLICLRIPLVAE